MNFKSTSAIARQYEIKASPDFFDYLVSKQLLVRENKRYILTPKGVSLGGTYKTKPNNGGTWVAWKEHSLDSIAREYKAISKNTEYQTLNLLAIIKLSIRQLAHSNNQTYFEILCIAKDDGEYDVYCFNQEFSSEERAINLMNKMKIKGVIDTTYWRKIEIQPDNTKQKINDLIKSSKANSKNEDLSMVAGKVVGVGLGLAASLLFGF